MNKYYQETLLAFTNMCVIIVKLTITIIN